MHIPLMYNVYMHRSITFESPLHHRNKRTTNILATKMSEVYMLTKIGTQEESEMIIRAGVDDSVDNAQFRAKSVRKRQACLAKFAKYAEEDSAEDDYFEDTSTFGKYISY